MIIGTVQETKTHEYRIGLTPDCVRAYCQHGHSVLVECAHGRPTLFCDNDFVDAGAELIDSADEVYRRADMIVKVKEPQPDEIKHLRAGQILFTYLHLAASESLTRSLIDGKVTAIAYEGIELDDGSHPCLQPMSEIAGRLAVQAGAACLEAHHGGRGVLLGGVPGAPKGRVAVLGAGTVGANAAKIALGMGADVTILDINRQRLIEMESRFPHGLHTLVSNEANLQKVLAEADLVIGAVLIPNARPPKIIRREHLRLMKAGSVIVDVAIDQGGCVETARPTTHDNPVFVEEGVLHYCVANMPGIVARTATLALTAATRPYGLMIANKGLDKACGECPPIQRGLHIHNGQCLNATVAGEFKLTLGDATNLK